MLTERTFGMPCALSACAGWLYQMAYFSVVQQITTTGSWAEAIGLVKAINKAVFSWILTAVLS